MLEQFHMQDTDRHRAAKLEKLRDFVEDAIVGAPYVGQVATRSMQPTFHNASFTKANAQSGHFARDEISTVQVAYANWYSSNTANEAGPGGSATFTASIQYPIGSEWQQFTWLGDPAVTVESGETTPLTDPLTLAVPIPKGARFLCRVYVDCAAGICFRSTNAHRAIALGDVMDAQATTLADATMSGATIPATTGSPGIAPVLIVGETTRPSLFLMGDSRQNGSGDTADGSGDVGEWARSIGPFFAYGNYGVSGESLGGATSWLANHSRRLALSAYYSHICGNYSINDLRAGRTAAQLIQDITSAVALFGGKPVYWNTIMTGTTSTDNWTTIANQSLFTNGPRTEANGLLLSGGVPGLTGVFDTAAVMESGTDGKLIVPGEPVTADGTHLNRFGYMRIKNSGVINPAVFASRL